MFSKMTRFVCAAMNGHIETVKVLLDRGADIHANNDGALHLAAKYGNTETVKLLLKYGATITPYKRNDKSGSEKEWKPRNYCIIEIEIEIFDCVFKSK